MSTASKSSPRVTLVTPVFGIASYEDAVNHYVNWLGFNLDWEWREAPGRPVIMSISRSGVTIMLNEAATDSTHSRLNLKVDDLQALIDEWNARRPGSVEIAVDPPYDIPTASVTDPFGNFVAFEQPITPAQRDAMEARKPSIRRHIRQRLDAGHPCPTPEQVVEAVGRPLGLALEVLNEFPEYEEATRE